MIYAVALQKVFSISFKDINVVTSSTSRLDLYYYNIPVELKSRDQGSSTNQKNDKEAVRGDRLVWKYIFELLNLIPLLLCHLACNAINAMGMMWLSCSGRQAANVLTL